MGLTVLDAINSVFLHGRFENRPLYLVLDNKSRELLAELLQKDVDAVEEYCCRVVGARLENVGAPYSAYEAELRRWNIRGRNDQPPFTDLLFALSHAAERMVSDGEFRASNYYERLSDLLNFDRGKLSFHGKATEQFWKAFNKWLADNDFAFGVPTARAVNANKYVGAAMSQAIVREADRQCLHSMFAKYSFSATDDISQSEMEQYISTWIRGSQPTRQLKEVWKKTELRVRICETAISELNDWQEDEEGGTAVGPPKVARLSLAINFRHDITSRSAFIYFGREESADPLKLETGDGLEIEISNSTFGAFATVEPRSSINIGNCLLRGLKLYSNGSPTHAWTGRAAIPFSRTEQGYWKEVSRTSLRVPHVLLVRDDKRVRNNIETALAEVATAGFTVSMPDKLLGMPPGWVLYENVVIERALQELRGFEAALSPIGNAANLQFEGGMKLGRGIWHLWTPPLVSVSASKGAVSLTAWESTGPDGEKLCADTSGSNFASLSLVDCMPDSGNIYLEGNLGKIAITSTAILFRSANRPRPLDRQSRGILSYNGVISTIEGRPETTGTIRGLEVAALPTNLANLDILPDFNSLNRKIGREKQPSDAVSLCGTDSVTSTDGLPPEEQMKLPCAVRGFHHFKYEMVPDGAPKNTPVDVECMSCGITFIHRRSGRAAATRNSISPVPETSQDSTETAHRHADVDLCLDGACFLGNGSMIAFETFLASQGIDTWRAGPLLRDLSWLGHLDVQTGPSHKPTTWSVSPPVFSLIADREAVFAGFRNRLLVQDIKAAILHAGGTLKFQERDAQPAVIKSFDLDSQKLCEALRGVLDPHNREIVVVNDASRRVLSIIDADSHLVNKFRPVTLGTNLPIQRYDVGANKWRNIDELNNSGAFRVSGAGTSYVYRTKSGNAYSGPHELVKLAAAREARVSLHSYDAQKKEFFSRLGCEPPALLGRALVACCGKLPTIAAGVSIFKKVPPDVAAAILDCLYTGELPK